MSGIQGLPYVFDLHSDIITDITMRRARGERKVFERLHAPRLMKSGVAAVATVIWVEAVYRNRSAERFVQQLTSFLVDLEESPDVVTLARTLDDLDAAHSQGKVAVFLAIEGMTYVEQWPQFETEEGKGDDQNPPSNEAKGRAQNAQADDSLLERLEQTLALLKPFGNLYSILVWGERNAIGSGPGRLYRPELGAGLTEFGRQAVRRLDERGVIIDLSHLDDTSIDDVLDTIGGTVIASHSNARTLCDVKRNLLDRHITEIGRRHGIIGMNAYPPFVHADKPTLDKFIDHIVYIGEKIGIDHVGLGFDFLDYLPGYENMPPEAAPIRVEQVPRLLERLSERGITEDEIRKVAHENALRVFFKRAPALVSERQS